MAIYSLLAKDLREHRIAALSLAAGCLVVVLLLLEQNEVAAYSMSSFEIVRFALISFLPLVALIVGNRLIVNEYLSGTRLFVEALPIGGFMPLLLKYVLGLSYIFALSTIMVLLAGRHSGMADDVTSEYLLLILAKTWVVVLLYWSVVFCFSLCGYLRVALYLVVIGIILLLAYLPGLDSSAFAPMALMDSQLFVYERDIIPWQQMGLTLLLSLVFTAVGFFLTRIGEGSVIERLAKPMTRRDYVALGVLAMSGLALASTLMENNQRDPIDFSSSSVIRLTDPDVSVLFIAEQYREPSVALAERTAASLAELQATLALPELPTVRLALAPSREKHDIDYATADGVFISANWLEHDSYDDAILDAVILHGVLSAQTNGRSVFEPIHWVLDGFTRWWVEQGIRELQPAHKHELTARALLALERDPQATDLISRWQLTADRFSYPSAEALAWSAMSFLEQEQGRDAVISLGREFLTQAVGSTALATFSNNTSRVQSRVEKSLNMTLEEFYSQWQSWLLAQRDDPLIEQYLNAVPAVTGSVQTVLEPTGVRSIQASYLPAPELSGASDLASLPGKCVIKHDYIGPFDTEFDVRRDNESSSACQSDEIAHRVDSLYASGDRVFLALDYEDGLFHQPIRLLAQRIYVP